MMTVTSPVVFFRRNPFIAFLFFLSTSFFIYQHSTGFSWDFATYVLNAKYLFGGYYFEWARPPLAPLTIAMLSFAGWLAAEYIYIIAVSALYLYSSLLFADAHKIDRKSFYAFSLTPFTLISAFSVGTEMFSAALLMLFMAFLSQKSSGAFCSLASLLRYSNFIYIPLLFFRKNAKEILLSLSLFLVVFVPWLLYNWHATGDPLTGIADYYAINFLFRSQNYAPQGFSLFDILLAWNILIPFFLLSVLVMIRTGKTSQTDKIMLSFLFLTVLSYSLAWFKEPRFLYASAIPLAYFAAKTSVKDKIIFIFSIISFTAVLFLPYQMENPNLYKHIAATSENCAIKSNAWVPLDYYGLPAEPFPYMEDVNASINDGYRIILFKNVADPSYVKNATFLAQFKTIEDNAAYIELGDKTKCRPAMKIDSPFLAGQSRFYKAYMGRETNFTPCGIFLPICR